MAEVLDYDATLATDFVNDRVRHFIRLHKPVKKLVLDVADYYLDLYFYTDAEAKEIVNGIRSQPDEQKMVDVYLQFLEFLPVRLRSGIQGRYLFQEPSMIEKQQNAERLIARDIEADQRSEQEIMQQLGLKDSSVLKNMDQLINKALDMEGEELNNFLSEMTGVSVEDVAAAAKEIGLSQ